MNSFSLIKHYFPEITAQQEAQLAALEPLYQEWNNKINLISRRDIHNLYTHHVLHSLSVAKVITCTPTTNVLDVGTGGGFPGVPLAILFPEAQFTLIDSIQKKINVVAHIASTLGLSNVTTCCRRGETEPGTYDVILARAVAPLKTLHGWMAHCISKQSTHPKPHGIFCLKGGAIEQELQELTVPYTVYPIRQFFKEPFFQEKYVVHLQ